MKKTLKILLTVALALTVVLGIVACNEKPSTPTIENVIGALDVDAGEYHYDIGAAYGEKPDLDNVVIDGNLDDDLWKDKKWYTQYEPTQRVKIEVTTAMSEGGLYIAAHSNDNFIYWNDYNYFFKNTHFRFKFYSGANLDIRIDAVSLRVTQRYINARSRVHGKYNVPGQGGGMSAELYIPWDQLGIDTTNGLPKTIKMYPLYNYCLNQNSPTSELFPTFVKTMGDSGQVTLFGADGYVNGDEENAMIGSHEGGQARTNGWTVENPGTENETATSSKSATMNFAQAIFYRELTASSFRVSTKIKIKDVDKDSRAGILLYRDNINYRAVALNLNNNTFKNGKMAEYNLKGYTNFPYNITQTTELTKVTPDAPTDEIEMTVYSKNGKLYYIINGAYAYSEEAAYVAVNVFAGFYAFNVTAEFYDYDYEVFANDKAFDEALAKYAYTIDIKNPSNKRIVVSTNQLAVDRNGGSELVVTMTFKKGYTLDTLRYVDARDRVTDLVEKSKTAVGGQFTLTGIDTNIELQATAKEIEGETIDFKANVVNALTNEKLRSAEVLLYGTKPYARYNERFVINQDYVLPVEAGNVWSYEVSASGYRNTKGVLFDGEALNASMDAPVDIKITNSVVGGTAEPTLDSNGNPVFDGTVASSPGTRWDLSQEAEGKVVFQTPDNDKDVIYFSGRTISSVQVAYVEITNRTDPSAFASFENDPAAGFIITTQSNESFMGFRQTGLRLKRERNNWTGGTWTDDMGKCRWNGYLGNTDRDNGGRFINAFQGTGTVDRIPYDGKEYTNSFLMIRNGPNYTFYGCDGAAGVTADFKNFEKLTKIGEFYNDLTPGPAAIGLTCTVAYNLRMDFENYWILAGKEAETFIGKFNADPLEITSGSDKVKLSGSALLDYTVGCESAKIVKDGEVTVSPVAMPANRILKVQFTDGAVKYLTDAKDSFTYKPLAVGGKVSMSVSEVEYVDVSGAVDYPQGVTPTALKGELNDENGKLVYQFTTKVDGKQGSFAIKVEKGLRGSVSILMEGYASNIVNLTGQSTNAITVSFSKASIGGSIKFDGKTIDTSAGGFVRNTDKGLVFDYQNENSGKGQLVLQEANKYTDNFVVTFSYERVGATGGKKEDGDASIGLRLYGGGTDAEFMFIGNGYRVYHDGDGGFDSRKEHRGNSPVNMSIKTTPAPYHFKVIKSGQYLYMLARSDAQTTYTLIYTADILDLLPTVNCGYVIGWFSFGYNDMEVYNINIETINAENAGEIYSQINLTASQGGKAEVVGESETTIGGNYAVKLTPAEGKRVEKITVNGANVAFVMEDGVAMVTIPATTNVVNVNVVFSDEIYEVVEKTKPSHKSARYVKAVCGDIVKVFKISRNANEFGETIAYWDKDSNDVHVMLTYATGTWTLSFYEDEACTKKCGGDLTVTVAK